jgi:hypothetical protein
LNKNFQLREKLKVIIEENEELKEENKEKTNALIELAEYYDVHFKKPFINILI